MRSLRCGVIGVGYFGRRHAAVYRQLPHAELVAVCDVSPEQARRVADELGCDHHTRIEELLGRDDIEAVSICTPDDSHVEPVLKALELEKHVLLEKPLAASEEDARAIVLAAKQSRRKFMVAHILRFDPRAIAVKQALDKGEIGEIVHIASKRNSPMTGARHYASRCTLPTHSGVHDLDLVRWFTGSEYTSVYAKARRVRLAEENLPGVDCYLAVLTLANGVIYAMENSWALPDNYPAYIDARMEIVGTRGVIFLETSNQGVSILRQEGTEYPDLSHWPEYGGQIRGDIRAEIEYFVDCVLGEAKPLVTAEDGFASAMAALAINQSLAEGRSVRPLVPSDLR